MQGWQHITTLFLSHQLSLQPVGEQHMHNVPTCSTKWQAWLKRTCMSTHHAFFLLAAEMCNKNARIGGLETACLVLRFSCSTAHTVDANAVAQAPLWVRVALESCFVVGQKWITLQFCSLMLKPTTLKTLSTPHSLVECRLRQEFWILNWLWTLVRCKR